VLKSAGRRDSEPAKRGKLFERSEFFPSVSRPGDGGRLSGLAALSFGSSFWAHKKKEARRDYQRIFLGYDYGWLNQWWINGCIVYPPIMRNKNFNKLF